MNLLNQFDNITIVDKCNNNKIVATINKENCEDFFKESSNPTSLIADLFLSNNKRNKISTSSNSSSSSLSYGKLKS